MTFATSIGIRHKLIGQICQMKYKESSKLCFMCELRRYKRKNFGEHYQPMTLHTQDKENTGNFIGCFLFTSILSINLCIFQPVSQPCYRWGLDNFTFAYLFIYFLFGELWCSLHLLKFIEHFFFFLLYQKFQLFMSTI